MKSISPAGFFTLVDFSWIYRVLCFRVTKLRFCTLPLVVVCVFLLCWNLLISSDDWITIYERAALESEESWLETVSIEDETVPACSLRHTVKNEDILRKHFKFTVPVFQWQDSFTLSTLKKLANETLPYGWKEQDPLLVGKTLSLLGNTSYSRLFERNGSHECVRCAVVGNGGILNGSGQGKLIDSHDYIFRVNGAIIKGFENDVGTKTSFYGFTINSLKNSLSAYQDDGFKKVPRDPGIGYLFIPAQTRDYIMLAAAIQGVTVRSGFDKGDRPSKYFGENSEFKMIHPYFIQYVTKKFLNSPQMEMYSDVYMPSTGALMLLTALHTCDQVSAFGFMTDNYKDFSDHYFDKVHRELVHYSNHDMMMESSFWKFLHTHKVMWLYQRQIKKG